MDAPPTVTPELANELLSHVWIRPNALDELAEEEFEDFAWFRERLAAARAGGDPYSLWIAYETGVHRLPLQLGEMMWEAFLRGTPALEAAKATQRAAARAAERVSRDLDWWNTHFPAAWWQAHGVQEKSFLLFMTYAYVRPLEHASVLLLWCSLQDSAAFQAMEDLDASLRYEQHALENPGTVHLRSCSTMQGSLTQIREDWNKVKPMLAFMRALVPTVREEARRERADLVQETSVFGLTSRYPHPKDGDRGRFFHCGNAFERSLQALVELQRDVDRFSDWVAEFC